MIIIFDFDGIINKADYFSVQYEKDFGISQATISEFFAQDFEKCAIGQTNIKTVLPPYLAKWKWPNSVESFLAYWFKNDVKLDIELLNFVEKLKKEAYYVVLASQQEVYRRNYIWHKLSLNKKFDAFYCSCDVGYLKSDERFYQKMLQDLQAKNKDISERSIIFFDDSPEFVAAAKKSGIAAYLIKENKEIFAFFGKK